MGVVCSSNRKDLEKNLGSSKFKPVDEQLAYLKKRTAEIIREAELKTNLG